MISANKVVLRPGFQQGSYPEKTAQNPSWFDAVIAQIGGFIAARLNLQKRRLQVFVRRVAKAGELLSPLDDVEFKGRINAMKKVLRRDGLANKHLAMAFAIVREVSARTLGMRHYDVQLMAGRVLIDGKLAEMETGEGKTLMAPLPASVAALRMVPSTRLTGLSSNSAKNAARRKTTSRTATASAIANHLSIREQSLQPRISVTSKSTVWLARLACNLVASSRGWSS